MAQVTVKLDWITGSCVQVQEIGRQGVGEGTADGDNKKKRSSSRRQLAGVTWPVSLCVCMCVYVCVCVCVCVCV